MYHLHIYFYENNYHCIDLVEYTFNDYKELLSTLKELLDDEKIHEFLIFKD